MVEAGASLRLAEGNGSDNGTFVIAGATVDCTPNGEGGPGQEHMPGLYRFVSSFGGESMGGKMPSAS